MLFVIIVNCIVLAMQIITGEGIFFAEDPVPSSYFIHKFNKHYRPPPPPPPHNIMQDKFVLWFKLENLLWLHKKNWTVFELLL